MAQKRLLTGLQPSGALHIGNYFGALKPFLDVEAHGGTIWAKSDGEGQGSTFILELPILKQ